MLGTKTWLYEYLTFALRPDWLQMHIILFGPRRDFLTHQCFNTERNVRFVLSIQFLMNWIVSSNNVCIMTLHRQVFFITVTDPRL